MPRTVRFTEVIEYRITDVPNNVTGEQAIQEWLDDEREATELDVIERQILEE